MFACICVNSPDTFIEDIEFIVCQTLLLEDCYDSIVDAATPNTHGLVFTTAPNTVMHHISHTVVTVIGIPVPGGVGSCPLLFVPSFLWRTFLALAQLTETGGAHQLQPVQSPHEGVKKNKNIY